MLLPCDIFAFVTTHVLSPLLLDPLRLALERDDDPAPEVDEPPDEDEPVDVPEPLPVEPPPLMLLDPPAVPCSRKQPVTVMFWSDPFARDCEPDCRPDVCASSATAPVIVIAAIAAAVISLRIVFTPAGGVAENC